MYNKFYSAKKTKLKNKTTKIKEADIDINPEFKKAFNTLENTKTNLLITGKAGTGKSTFLEYFVNHTKKSCVVLAPTGVAALNVNGETIHSFFHFHPNISKNDVLTKARRVKKDSIYNNIDIIIIDEISMVRADLFDYIDIFLRTARKNKSPFGGVQMCLIGDLFQLPPIVTKIEKSFFVDNYNSHYFFGTEVFRDMFFQLKCLELETVYRQSDTEFINVLNAIRDNKLEEVHFEFLNERVGDVGNDEDYVTIVATNRAADKINQENLDKLKTKSKKYVGLVKGRLSEGVYPTDLELTLKVGAKVMFLVNDSKGRWVNGTIGEITDLDDDKIVVGTDSGQEFKVEPFEWEVNRYVYDEDNQSLEQELVGAFKQFPLRLSWAITVHKSQGKSFDKVIIDMGWGTFVSGQLYVALSRCRTSEGLVIRRSSRMNVIETDLVVTDFLRNIERI
jgi:GTPase SAR1 family protein